MGNRNRPYVILSVATSVDGYIDDTTAERLILSNDADFDQVDQVRAESDAVLIGAETLRRDNPRLLVKSPQRRAEREARGLPAYPYKVTLTRSGDIDPDLRFFHSPGERLVYTATAAVAMVRDRLGELADVVPVGDPPDLAVMLADLAARGVRQLMVEGGGQVHTQFLAAGLADEIRLAVAPFFVGNQGAARFVNPATFPAGPGRRMVLARAEAVGDMAVMHYLPAVAVTAHHQADQRAAG
jgi:riboflavin-specific deaminase-like protein